MTRLLALLLLSIPLQAGAQASTPPEASKPKLSCPCDQAYFKPLTEKGKAAADYWSARRRYKIATGVSGSFLLLGYLFRDLNTMRDADQSFQEAHSALVVARSRAESLGAVIVTDDLDGPIEWKIVEGVDYTTAPPKP